MSDLLGRWRGQRSCAAAFEVCPQNDVSELTTTVDLDYVFVPGSLTIVETVELSGRVEVPKSCVSTCEFLQLGLNMQPGLSGQCTDVGPACSCRIDGATTRTSTASFDIGGPTTLFIEIDEQRRSFDFCLTVAGELLLVSESDAVDRLSKE